MHLISAALVGSLGLIALAGTAQAARDDADDYPYLPLDHPALQYAEHPTNDPVSRLQVQIDQGQVKLDYEPGRWGYLRSLLKHLQIDVDSQMLVFSKTSFQAQKISPKRPRALYFNDNAAVGFVQDGEVMEVASLDPTQGVLFYSLDIQKSQTPRFVRRDSECLRCHLIPGTLNVPGLVVSSVIPSSDGSPRFPGAGVIIDGRSPLSERWGGWYVSGTTGALEHRGNAVAPDPLRPDMLDLRDSQNLTSLAKRFDTSAYLTGMSDIVALLTLEHQTRMVNLMTRLGWETRAAMQNGKLEDFRERLDFLAEQTALYMLFADEAPIKDPITGVSDFVKNFPKRGPRDKQGRSLRDFDLSRRLFRYPLSYMIYSDAFEGLPEAAKQRVYRRLHEVLTGKDTSEKFACLSAEDRRAVLDILIETKPNLPGYWRTSHAAAPAVRNTAP
ncbi:MAG TPA: hypothetical protein VEV17_11095 [Bryobacteraceae bacterium]|nr:hypothetical protein [Bryobacteraceae bacterium]